MNGRGVFLCKVLMMQNGDCKIFPKTLRLTAYFPRGELVGILVLYSPVLVTTKTTCYELVLQPFNFCAAPIG